MFVTGIYHILDPLSLPMGLFLKEVLFPDNAHSSLQLGREIPQVQVCLWLADYWANAQCF